jgi:uncharacterized protein
MAMGRVLILVLLGLVLAWWLYSRIDKLRNKQRDAPSAAPTGAQNMVACAHCGVHLPMNEAVKEGELHFCGEPHRLLGPRP